MKHTVNHGYERSLLEVFVDMIDVDVNLLLDWVEQNFMPEEVFDDGELDEWAENHDYHQAPDDEPPDREL